MKPYPYNEYPCPECDSDVRVEFSVGKYITCYNCHAKLEIHPDVDVVDGATHDKTRLSLVETEHDHMLRMLEWAKSQKP